MIRARESSSMHLNLENFDMEEGKAQYNVFQDYLGLINLICPSNKFSNSYPEGCDVMYTFPTEGIHRHRMDSLDSDALSDSSSSGESREMELMDGSERYSYSSNPSPPLSGILDTPPLSYSQTLESLIIARKTALNRIQPKESRNTKNNSNNKATVCVFCRNNGESREFYSSHTLKDNEGNTACPILRAYTCPLCKANGDNSHTIKYCPKYTPKLKNEKLLGIGIML